MPWSAAKRAAARIDHTCSDALHRLSLGVAEYLLLPPAMLFGSYLMPVTLLVLAFAMGVRAAVVCALAGLFTVACTEALKRLFERARPEHHRIARRRMNLRGLVTNPAFPSGDSAQAAVVATALFLQTSSWLWLVAMLPTMVARVYFGCHWVGDTLGGAAVGAALTSAVHAVVDPLLA